MVEGLGASFLGPLWEKKETADGTFWVLRPFVAQRIDDTKQEKNLHILYPVFNKRMTPTSTEWDFLRFIKKIDSPEEKNFYIFPFIFDAETGDPETSHEGFFPLGGTVSQFLGKDRVRWWMFPLFAQTEKGETIKRYTPWPFLQTMDGDAAGWGVWPFYGKFSKENGWGQAFYLWPLGGYQRIPREGEDIEMKMALPFYFSETSANRENKNYAYPFIGYTNQEAPAYEETRYLWPFFVQGEGEGGRFTNRWAPFYTHSYFKGVEKTWVAWPFYRQEHWIEKDYLLDKTQFLYFLYWNLTQTPVDDLGREPARKTHLWPLYSYWNDGNGHTQWQALSPLEVFFQHNEEIRFIYTPLFSLFTHETKPDYSQWQALWKLWKYERAGDEKTWSLDPLVEGHKSSDSAGGKVLKGLVGTKKEKGKRTFTILWKEFHL